MTMRPRTRKTAEAGARIDRTPAHQDLAAAPKEKETEQEEPGPLKPEEGEESDV